MSLLKRPVVARAASRGTCAGRYSLLSAACLLALSSTALAQSTPADQASLLDTVVVTGERAETGTKTDTRLTEVPQSISVVSAEQFNERTTINFQDIFRYSAGVSTELQGVDTRVDRFAVRGFAAAQYLDGLNRMPDGIYGARVEPYTLDRAEVLRGPSSVLYGAGSAGGLLNAASKLPSHQFGGEVGLIVGTHNRKEVRVDVKGGLSDTVAGRIVALKRDGDMQFEDQNDNRLTVMPSITWTPGADTSITALAVYQKEKLGTHTYLPWSRTAELRDGFDRLPLDFFLGDKGFNHMNTEYRSVSLMVDHAFNDSVSFGSRTRYYLHDVDYAELYGAVSMGWLDADRTLMPRHFYVLREGYEGLNSDNNVTIRFRTGPLDHLVLAGIDYTLFKQDRKEGFSCAGSTTGTCFSGGMPPPLDLENPNYYEDFAYGFTNMYTTRSTQVGYYVQDQIRYADRVSLVLGARRDRATSEVRNRAEPVSHATTYRVGVIGDLPGGVSPYISYSESFRPVFGGDFYGNPYQPREGTQYEAGVKWQVNPHTLFNVAVFDIEDSNYLMQDPAFIQNFIQIGQANAEGYEFEMNGRVLGLDVNAAYSYTKATNASGARIPEVAERLASVWVAKSFPVGDDMQLRVGGGARYMGDKIDDGQRYLTRPVTLADAMVELDRGSWKYALNVSNLLGKEYVAYCNVRRVDEGMCYPGGPRTVLASVRYLF